MDPSAPSNKELSTALEDTNRGEPLIDWESSSDLSKPTNWSPRKRWTILLLISGYGVLNPLCSTAISPSLSTIASELHIESPVAAEISLSIFVLGMGLGPLVLGPLSEMYGRLTVLMLGNMFFIAWNTGCGFASNEAELVLCRFFSGVGSSASLSVLTPTVSDLFRPDSRGTALAIAVIAQYVGLGLGPIAAGYITQYASWRWVLWGISIVDFPLLVAGFVWLRETYPPILLRRKADELEKRDGRTYLTVYDTGSRQTLAQKLAGNFIRPIRLITTQIIIMILCAYFAVAFGTMFVLLFSYPLLWQEKYGQTTGQIGLNYISTSIGYVLGTQASGRLSDHISTHLLTHSPTHTHRPEFRIPLILPGSLLCTAGLLLYGWTGQFRLHWTLPNIGNALFMAGCGMSTQAISAYTIDAYARYSASALATLNLVRSIAGFAFPLFAPALYRTLEWGWGSTVLAAVIGVVGVGAAGGLWRWGKGLRGMSVYAAGGFVGDE